MKHSEQEDTDLTCEENLISNRLKTVCRRRDNRGQEMREGESSRFRKRQPTGEQRRQPRKQAEMVKKSAKRRSLRDQPAG